MLRYVSRRLLATPSPVTPTILEAGQIAEWVIEQIDHSLLSGLEGKCEAASYDISGNCWKHYVSFSEKFKKREKLIKLAEDQSQFVHVDDMGLNDFDALILAKLLKLKSPSVQLLDMNKNPLVGDVGLAHVCRHVISPSSPVKLRSLFMSGCSITDDGIAHLLPALKWKEQSLHILELRNNAISDEGAEALSEVLSFETTGGPPVFSLFLNGNTQIGERGAVALAKAVVESGGRLKVWLNGTCSNLSQEDKAEIIKFTKHHIKF